MTDSVYQQLDYLADAISKVEEQMIDPRDFGRLEAEVREMQRQVTALNAKLDQLVELASQGKGGIRALWFAGSMMAGAAGWFGADKLLK